MTHQSSRGKNGVIFVDGIFRRAHCTVKVATTINEKKYVRKTYRYLIYILCYEGLNVSHCKCSFPSVRKKIIRCFRDVNHVFYLAGGTIVKGSQAGTRNNQDTSDAVQQYDPETNKWTSFSTLPCKMKRIVACAFNDKIYITGE